MNTRVGFYMLCFWTIIQFGGASDSFSQEKNIIDKLFPPSEHSTGLEPSFLRSSALNAAKDTNNSLPPPITSSSSRDSGISLSRVALSAGVLGAAILGFHIYQNNAWWSGQRTAFHVIEDPDYQGNFDKAGHVFGAYYGSHFFDEAFQWTGMDSAQSTMFGALCGAIWEYYVEVEDGFAAAWGFSRGDAKSDLTGATFYLLRNRIPFLRNFNYKWSYVPTQKYLQNRPDIPGQSLNFIEDYGGQTYYLTMDIHGMLPQSMKSYWPSWLNLALGIGGSGLDTYATTGNPFINRKLAWYVSLDYDIEKIFPESDIPFLNFLRRAFNYWHLPAPAYRIYPDHRLFVLFPFQMTIGK